MWRYRTWPLFMLFVLTPATGQTSDSPRVQGLFVHGAEYCKRRCVDDAACFQECAQHELTHDELMRSIDQERLCKKRCVDDAACVRECRLKSE